MTLKVMGSDYSLLNILILNGNGNEDVGNNGKLLDWEWAGPDYPTCSVHVHRRLHHFGGPTTSTRVPVPSTAHQQANLKIVAELK